MVKHRITRKYKIKRKSGGTGSRSNSPGSNSRKRSRSSSRSPSRSPEAKKPNVLTMDQIKKDAKKEMEELDRIKEARNYVKGKSKFDVFQVLVSEQPMFFDDFYEKMTNSDKRVEQTTKLQKFTQSTNTNIRKVAISYQNTFINNNIKRNMINYINNNSLYEQNTEIRLNLLLKMCTTELRELLNEYEQECDEYEAENNKHTGTDRMLKRTYEDMKICTIYLRYIVGYL